MAHMEMAVGRPGQDDVAPSCKRAAMTERKMGSPNSASPLVSMRIIA